SPGTGRKKDRRVFFRPVPGLRRDRLSPSADALGYYLAPCGLESAKKLPPGRRRQPVHSGVADGGARRGVGRRHDAMRIGGTLQEALDIGGQLPVPTPLAFAFPDGAT